MRSYLCEENRRKDEIIMQQAVTMQQITAAQEEPREFPGTVVEEPEGHEGRPFTEEAQEGSENPSWWRRWFGFH